MKYALIGCGRIASRHIQAALDNKLDIGAVCDHSPEKMERLLTQFGLEKDKSIGRFTCYQEMLQKVKPQLTAIATPSGSHGKIGLDCIRHGTHLLIEKPIALSLREARELAVEGEKRGVLVGVCHQNRFNPPVLRLRQAIEAGKLGKLSHGTVHVRWHRDKNYYSQASWRGTWAEDGGALMNQCIHGIDLLNWMIDSQPVQVYGVTRQRFHPYLEGEDVGLAILQYENGVIASVEGTTNVYPENLEETLCLFGEKGTVGLGGRALERTEVWKVEGQSFEEESPQCLANTDNVYGQGHTALYRDMIEAIHQRRRPAVDAWAGVQALELVLAVYKSQKEGRSVALPLEDYSTLDMKGMFP